MESQSGGIANSANSRGRVWRDYGLADEVLRWEAIEFPNLIVESDDQKKVIYLQDAEGLENRDSLVQVGIGWCWGWLPAQGLGAKGDKWVLHFTGEVTERPEWEAVVMPRAWGGYLNFQLSGGNQRDGVLVSEFKIGVVSGWWGAKYQETEAPELPQLGKGEESSHELSELSLWGVMRQPRSRAGLTFWTDLSAAWGDREGNFLGWEVIDSMAEIHSLDISKARQLGPMPTWDEMEPMIRRQVWGREL